MDGQILFLVILSIIILAFLFLIPSKEGYLKEGLGGGRGGGGRGRGGGGRGGGGRGGGGRGHWGGHHGGRWGGRRLGGGYLGGGGYPWWYDSGPYYYAVGPDCEFNAGVQLRQCLEDGNPVRDCNVQYDNTLSTCRYV